MRISPPHRRAITFYSYKGGVGRTMAMANVAFRLADLHALDVIVVDWDLEAPGLHKFFDISAEAMATAQGVLDYFHEWRAAVARKDPAPPQVSGWLLRIEGGPFAPRHGSVRLLVAGRQDAHYEDRLAAFGWKDLYAEGAGAAAVEVLRKQLVEDADVVLVDSRTGLTDSGGICTVQLPDAVVLMTAPNRQSLEGIERVARTIACAGEAARAGRGRAQVWLSVARVPFVEETTLADQWFKDHAPWFARLADEGLLRRDEHTRGLQTYAIPQRSRWGFDETLLIPSRVDAEEPLAMAYERLTLTILQWVAGADALSAPSRPLDPGEREAMIEELRQRAVAAEQRGDVPGLLVSLLNLGTNLASSNAGEALDVLARAEAIALGAEAWHELTMARVFAGSVMAAQGRRDDSIARLRDAIELAHRIKFDYGEGLACLRLGSLLAGGRELEDAMPLLASAIDCFRRSGHEREAVIASEGLRLIHQIRVMATEARVVETENNALRRLAEQEVGVSLLEGLVNLGKGKLPSKKSIERTLQQPRAMKGEQDPSSTVAQPLPPRPRRRKKNP